jgi:sec-independent protein translocase protein TatB
MFPEDRFVEILIIGALALIVIGPKDLPVLMRKLGRYMGKMRAMAAEFRASFDELARQSELDELRREVDALRQSQTYPGAHLRAAQQEINQSLAADAQINPSGAPAPQVAETPADRAPHTAGGPS